MIVLILVGLGLILGSFVNALVWRLQKQEELKDSKSKKKPKHAQRPMLTIRELSMLHGRSMCSNCHHPLAPKDLVPLLSWSLLRGKCRYCHKPIEDTPFLELGLPIAFVSSYLFWPLPLAADGLSGSSGYGLLAFIVWLVMLVGFAALTVYDIRWFLLPDKIVWPLAALALIQVVLHATVLDGDVPVLATAFWGVIICSGIFYVLYTVSKGEWIGGGDVKLGVILGLLVGGPLAGLLLIFTASLLGTLVSLPMLLQKKLQRTSIIPFGPFLMLATMIVVLFGQQIIDHFSSLLLVP